MTETQNTPAERCFRKLDAFADLGAGFVGLSVILRPAGLTVVHLAEAKALQIPAIPITTEDGDPAWMLVQYVKKPRKGSKAKTIVGFWSDSNKKIVDCAWMEDLCAPLACEFHKGGWPFPLRSFIAPNYL